jgi:hypothetical protein
MLFSALLQTTRVELMNDGIAKCQAASCISFMPFRKQMSQCVLVARVLFILCFKPSSTTALVE